MAIPILTYHSLNTTGRSYATNDHVALEADLKTIKRLGFRVERLSTLVDAFNRGSLADFETERVCALTFDDGVTHDFIDYYHPARGMLKSFARILAEATDATDPSWMQIPATSFVIVSPEARAILDLRCIKGEDQWHDHWWEEAIRDACFDIGNHSWDHTHPELPTVAQREQVRGDFFCVDNRVDAYHQILDAEAYLARKLGDARSRLFAYPYGHVSEFLRDEFFPEHASDFRGALSTGGDYFTQQSCRWAIPRFVCGEHWQAPEGLEAILESAKPSDEVFGNPSFLSDVTADCEAETATGRKPPFFIVGSVRSGTSLLRDLLRQHPNLHSPEETHFFRWPHAFGSIDFNLIQERDETLKLHRELDGVSEDGFSQLLRNAKTRRELQDGYAGLFLEAQGVGSGRWFDKTPQNIYGLTLLSAVYPEAKFVCIVRHPLNVIASLKRGKVMAAHSLTAAINTWLEADLIAQQFQAAWPGRLHIITYEALTESPQSALSAALKFIGEPCEALDWDFLHVHREENRYEQELTADEAATIRRELAPNMSRYGYV